MSFFKKALASIGIGSAKVDTVLDEASVIAGQTLSGTVHIQGGQAEQQVDRIYLTLKTQYLKEENDRKVTYTADIARFLLTEGFLLQAGEKREIPFSFPVPAHTPLTLRQAPVWVETGLDIPVAIDPTDRDHIEVVPSVNVQTVLDALELLGFRLREVSNDYAPKLGRSLPFVQEFEFVPTTHFAGRLDELEVLFFPEGEDLELFLQIDRKARGLFGRFAESMEMDESFVRFTIPGSELRRGAHTVAEQLRVLIERYS